jgi:hypothetical protein
LLISQYNDRHVSLYQVSPQVVNPSQYNGRSVDLYDPVRRCHRKISEPSMASSKALTFLSPSTARM